MTIAAMPGLFRLYIKPNSNFAYITYLVEGLLSSGVRLEITDGIPSHFTYYEKEDYWTEAVFLFSHQERGTCERFFCIDLLDEHTSFYHEAVTDPNVLLYFKSHYVANDISKRCSDSSSFNKVRSFNGIFFSVQPSMLRFSWSLRHLWRRPRRLMSLVRNISSMYPSVDQMRRLRTTIKSYDLVFFLNLYDNPLNDADNVWRIRLFRELRALSASRPDLRLKLGIVRRGPLPSDLESLRMDRKTLNQYLAEIAKARMALYVRGVGGCVSFKLGQYLALGLPIIGQPVAAEHPIYQHIPNYVELFRFEEPAELVSGLEKMLSNGQKLQSIERENVEFFERRLTPMRVAKEWLQEWCEWFDGCVAADA